MKTRVRNNISNDTRYSYEIQTPHSLKPPQPESCALFTNTVNDMQCFIYISATEIVIAIL